jgi:predicted RNA-binding protein with RPS1 domain
MIDMSAEAELNLKLEPKTQYKGKVIKINLAGAVLDIGIGKPALLHITQITAPENTQIKKVEDVLQVGQEIEVWIKRIARKDDEERIELTMNRPLDLEWREVKVGNTVKGKVVRLEKFGAFVEIGAERPGLVHISEMAHGYVKVPSDVVKEGDEIEAQIIEVNRRKKQIKLSMKAIQPEPEVVVEEKPKPSAAHTANTRNANPRSTTEPRREKRVEKKPRRNSEVDNSALLETINEPAEVEPTVMEIAMRSAMEKAKDRKKSQESKKNKVSSREQEEILTRTLENKVQTN